VLGTTTITTTPIESDPRASSLSKSRFLLMAPQR
jgi:hypothetical protein